MTIKELTMDSTFANVSSTATFSSGDTIVLPHLHRVAYFQFPAIATAGTLTVEAALNATFVDVREDVDGNVYPRTSFSGDTILSFLVPPGAKMRITASNASTLAGTLVVKTGQ